MSVSVRVYNRYEPVMCLMWRCHQIKHLVQCFLIELINPSLTNKVFVDVLAKGLKIFRFIPFQTWTKLVKAEWLVGVDTSLNREQRQCSGRNIPDASNQALKSRPNKRGKGWFSNFLHFYHQASDGKCLQKWLKSILHQMALFNSSTEHLF